MFKHILVSTDGSPLSGKAIRAAVRLARATGARVTGAYVTAPFVAPAYSEGAMYAPMMSAKRYKELCGRESRKALAAVEIEARTAGVESGAVTMVAGNPWQGILRAARSKNCDLIVMASHGPRGLSGLLLGSETNKVLTHSKIPVLVYR